MSHFYAGFGLLDPNRYLTHTHRRTDRQTGELAIA